MGPTETAAVVARVVADAEWAFGRGADAALLGCYAREATLDLWLARPGLTVRQRDLVLRWVLAALDRGDAPPVEAAA